MVVRAYVYPEPSGSGNNRNGRAGHPTSGVVAGAARSGEPITDDRTLDIGAIAQMLPGGLAKLAIALISVIAQMTPAARALLAADLVKCGLSVRQALALTGASPGYTSTAFHLSAEQRALVDCGKATLSQYHNARKADREIEALIRREGGGRVLAVLDRMTAPTK